MTIVKTARWSIQKYAPQNVHKFDISAGNENVSFDIKFSCDIEDSSLHTICDAVSLKFFSLRYGDYCEDSQRVSIFL